MIFTSLEGAAKTAYDLGNYQLAHHYLLRAAKLPESAPGNSASRKQANDELVHKVSRTIVLDASPDLPPGMLASRLLGDREIARKRLNDCVKAQPTSSDNNAETSADALSDLPPALANVVEMWAAEPKPLTAANLENTPQLQKQEDQLIDETEKAAALVCGPPSGDDAILLRLAEVPSVSSEVPDHE